MNKTAPNTNLFSDIKSLIEQGKQQVAVAINSTITTLYWQIGNRIKTDILQNKRAEYGQEIVKQLSVELTKQYGKGWSEKHLRHCLRFAEVFTDIQIVSALRRQLSWTHFKAIMYFDDELQREFYIEMCKLENWSTRVLEERINSMLYERTAIIVELQNFVIEMGSDFAFMDRQKKFRWIMKIIILTCFFIIAG